MYFHIITVFTTQMVELWKREEKDNANNANVKQEKWNVSKIKQQWN